MEFLLIIRFQNPFTPHDGESFCDVQIPSHEFEQTLGDGEGKGRLAYCSPRGQRESGTNEGQKNNKFCADVQVPSTGCSEAQVYPALCSTWFSLKTRRGLPMTLSLAEAI